MTQQARWTWGSVWIDNLVPVAIGLLAALSVMWVGGPVWTLLLVPALSWSTWQLARWFERRLVGRVLLVVSLAVAILSYVFLFSGVDTAKLRETVSDAGIEVDTVSSDGNGVSVSIQAVSWGPDRNKALRAIFAAAHAHARSKKRVSIQWGDAMTTTIEMKDIEAFISGRITYREMLNRMEWFGTPDVLPEDSNTSRAPGCTFTTAALAFDDGQIWMVPISRS